MSFRNIRMYGCAVVISYYYGLYKQYILFANIVFNVRPYLRLISYKLPWLSTINDDILTFFGTDVNCILTMQFIH